MNAIGWPATEFATWTTTKFAVTRSLPSGKSTTILDGRSRGMQSSACVSWLQARPGGNLQIIDIIYRNLVRLRRKCSVCSRRIVSDLAYRRWLVKNSGHRIETSRFQNHKSDRSEE